MMVDWFYFSPCCCCWLLMVDSVHGLLKSLSSDIVVVIFILSNCVWLGHKLCLINQKLYLLFLCRFYGLLFWLPFLSIILFLNNNISWFFINVIILFSCSDSWTGWSNVIFSIWTFIYSCHSKEAFQFKIQFPNKERCMGWYLREILLHSRYSSWWLSRLTSTSSIITFD